MVYASVPCNTIEQLRRYESPQFLKHAAYFVLGEDTVYYPVIRGCLGGKVISIVPVGRQPLMQGEAFHRDAELILDIFNFSITALIAVCPLELVDADVLDALRFEDVVSGLVKREEGDIKSLFFQESAGYRRKKVHFLHCHYGYEEVNHRSTIITLRNYLTH